MSLHSFSQQLQYSQRASDEAFWMTAYRKAFPTLVNAMPCPGDFESQRQGIDRVILLGNGRLLRIDEKKRTNTYADILLEYLSNSKTKAPGWIEKDLAIDYLAYAFMPTRKVYLLDWQTLRRAWRQHGDDWKMRYRNVPAYNVGYVTWGVAVPIPTLFTAMQNVTCIQL